MAEDLRKDWHTLKSWSFEQFKKDFPAPSGMNIITHGPTPYPAKFKKDLGKELDGWKNAKNQADKDKHKNAALAITTEYKIEIRAAKVGSINWKDKPSGSRLIEQLLKIEAALRG